MSNQIIQATPSILKESDKSITPKSSLDDYIIEQFDSVLNERNKPIESYNKNIGDSSDQIMLVDDFTAFPPLRHYENEFQSWKNKYTSRQNSSELFDVSIQLFCVKQKIESLKILAIVIKKYCAVDVIFTSNQELLIRNIRPHHIEALFYDLRHNGLV